MFRAFTLSLILALVLAQPSLAVVLGPYTADANTLHLYHLDETSGALVDVGNGTTYNLTDTGGATGRDGTGAGGYGGAAYTGFGNSFNPLLAGSGSYHTSASTIGGGALGGSVAQSAFQAANGAFTIETLINTANTADEQEIFAHDGDVNRGGLIRILNGTLAVFNGQASSTSAAVTIPTSGAHAFAANEWFHLAVTYTGEAGTNLQFYWTRLDADATEANLIGTGSIGGDFNSVTQALGLGGTTRGKYRFEVKGLIDEVRISDIVRGADDFLFAAVPPLPIPEPGTLGMALALGALAVVRRRRR